MSDPSVFWLVPLWCHCRAGCRRTLADVGVPVAKGKSGSLHLLARHTQRTTEVALVPLRTLRPSACDRRHSRTGGV